MSVKIVIIKGIAFLLMFFFFSVAGLLAHEAGHLIINNILGGTGMIYYNYLLTSGHMEWITLPQNHIWLVYLAGGIFAAIFLSFVWFAAWLTPSKQDTYIEAAVAGQILTNLFYAPTELILYYRGAQLFEWAWITAYVVATIVFFLLYTKKIVNWLSWPVKLMNGTTP